jgi:HK97 family phage major capsid protein
VNLRELLEKRAKLAADARALLKKAEDEKRDLKAEEKTEWDRIMAEVKTLGEQIERAQQMAGIEAELGRSLQEPIKPDPAQSTQQAPAGKGPFRSLGEQLVAVAQFSKSNGRDVDPRLFEVRALGLNEAIPSEGGFLIQTDFQSELIKRTYETALLAGLCRKIGISAGANGVRLNAIDETSRVAGSRWGGIQGYWLNEAGTKTASKPKFRQIDLKLEKLIGVCYATDELLQDASALESVIMQAFPEEFGFLVDAAIFSGTGAGQPLGILNSGAVVQVAKEAGQAADTVVAENISKMWARMWAPSRRTAVWLINQDVEPQLDLLSVPSGAFGMPVYMPPGGLSEAPYGRLKGRPVMVIEHCETLGDAGDIVLSDFSQYLLADKNGIETATSIHVQFLTDETTFRFVYRVDGEPVWNAALTPAKGSNTLSPFVKLAARA